ncbi:MAG: hypothetical protein AAGF23_19745, partial [Acidobacteriota bacterium]
RRLRRRHGVAAATPGFWGVRYDNVMAAPTDKLHFPEMEGIPTSFEEMELSEYGLDLGDIAQIRECLELEPLERLRRMERLVNAVRRIRAQSP